MQLHLIHSNLVYQGAFLAESCSAFELARVLHYSEVAMAYKARGSMSN